MFELKHDQFAKSLELLTPDGSFNYAAYLLSDVNGTSIKVAKYAGLDRLKLLENEEYGYCCLIKATKAVLEKLRIENKTFARITPVKRDERKLLDPEALREAVINAIIHNDYSNEVPPKFELFDDRLEITSAGSLPDGFDEDEFFKGYSVPKNKELMRVFRDLEMVEQLGSGIPRILAHYPKSSYLFTGHFVRLILPFSAGFDHRIRQASDQASDQASQVLIFCSIPRSIKEIMEFLGVKHRTYLRKTLLVPLVESGKLTLTIPEKPSSPNQRYIATER